MSDLNAVPYPTRTDTWNHRCPFCGQHSLTFDRPRNGYFCHVYAGFIPVERMPR